MARDSLQTFANKKNIKDIFSMGSCMGLANRWLRLARVFNCFIRGIFGIGSGMGKEFCLTYKQDNHNMSVTSNTTNTMAKDNS